jgi:hypothetical protein
VHSPERLKVLVVEHDWNRVYYITVANYPIPTFESAFLGPRISEQVRGFIYDYHKYLDKKEVDNIVKILGSATNLFLGDYMRSVYQVPHMYHFANTLKHERLFLLDDGTNVNTINDDRRIAFPIESNSNGPGSYLYRLKKMLRDRLIEWNDKAADSVTFFSAYDINVQDGDFLIKNEYKYLRSLTKNAAPSDEVFFLGQCMVEGGYMTEEVYLEYLNKINDYFAHEKMIYIPHPRESAHMIGKIREYPGLTIKSFNVPIECEICLNGNRPKVLASFFSSALQNCRIMLGDISIIAFYVPPVHLLRDHEYVNTVYQYYSSHTSELFTIVTL